MSSLYLTPKERNKIEFDRLCKKCFQSNIILDEKELSNYDYNEFASKFIHSLITKNDLNKKYIDSESWTNSSIFYRKYMSNPNTPLYVEMDDIVPDFNQVFNLIKECNGLLFIPHIYEYRDNSEKILKYILDNYKINGIECFYTTFSKEQSNNLLSICKDKNLYISGGSDYHGNAKPNVSIGTGYGNLNINSSIVQNWI